MPHVTVVTAAYNAAPFIAETIESVLAQTFTDFDYIVVDDGSSDATPDIIAQYTPKVTCIRQSKSGTGRARNRGLELANGRYVAIVDADDIWEPLKLERQVVEMERNPDAGLCYTNAIAIRADESVLVPAMVAPHSPLTCLAALTGGNPIVTSSVLYRRAFLERHPYGSLQIAEDYHVHLKVLWRSGEQAVFVDEPLVRYRVLETSVLRQVDARERGRLTLEAVEAFIDDMRVERPLPADLERRALAFAHYQWACYCIHGRVAYGFALRQLTHALLDDWHLAPKAARQACKALLFRTRLR